VHRHTEVFNLWYSSDQPISITFCSLKGTNDKSERRIGLLAWRNSYRVASKSGRPQRQSRKLSMTSSAFSLHVVLIVVLATLFCSGHGADREEPGRPKSRREGRRQDSLVVPPSPKVPYGRLSVDWWRWASSSTPDFTFVSEDSCLGDQIYHVRDDVPVFFLAGIGYPNEPADPINIVRKKGCNVPKGSYLMIPAVNTFSALNPGGVENLVDGTNTTNQAEYLLQFDNTKNLTEYSLTVDGKLVTKTGERILSDVEPFDAPNHDIINGTGQGLGVWNVLRPLPEGTHELRACTTLDLIKDPQDNVIKFCVTYILKVLGK
jgi:hypothetical protein